MYNWNKKNCNNNCGMKNVNSFNFCQKKENTLCSLYEIENFLCNFNKALKCFNIYRRFK